MSFRFEVNIGIIAACTPALRPGYKLLRERMQGYFRSKSHAQLGDEVHLQPIPAAFGKDAPKVQPSDDLNSNITETYHPV